MKKDAGEAPVFVGEAGALRIVNLTSCSRNLADYLKRILNKEDDHHPALLIMSLVQCV